MQTCKSLDLHILPRDVITRKLTVPNAERIFFFRHALRARFTVEKIFNLTKIDRWFLVPGAVQRDCGF
jgi:carbamoyl-phosphate synthase large subunit